MSSTATGGTTADRQRQRASRGIGSSAPSRNRTPSPPRQRRPAMAALAVLLIVGGALLAGLLAIRMDSRVPVLTVNREIPAGTQITGADLAKTQVASEELQLIDADLADQVVGTYARTTIMPNQLIDQRMLTRESPLSEGRAIVSMLLSAALTPEGELEPGDKVMVIRVDEEAGGTEGGQALTEALVVGKSRSNQDSLGGANAGSVTLLVPDDTAEAVVGAAGANKAGLALLSRGNSAEDVTLEPAVS